MTSVDPGVPVLLPTLTEVVDPGEWEARRPFAGDLRAEGEVDVANDIEPPLPVAPSHAPAPAYELPSEQELVRRVMVELERQIDLMLEYRLREMLSPLLARVADTLVRDTRSGLASTLRDVVARAVASELASHRSTRPER